ncbi:hypothetical protein OG763_14470 [Streptomyces sp. NBC_01230]|uniref:hypothetical protein n=1 Tax=Streptomyces sp. NBC_01230 TaxID=2903784 RepID=UPI002E15840F|nr:hypothetical protein OG763_14470 [Streptomyces sp. NBC_01230]
MSDVIRIQPTAEQRQAFARWAVAQKPKVRTVGTNVFAVPAALFVEAPESVLVGSLVDGTRYVSPDEDAATAGTPELLGVATTDGFHEAVPGEALPEVPAEAYGPDSAPLPAPSEHSDSSEPAVEAPQGVFPCDGCDREFTSERGRDTHRRQKHAEA